MCFLSAEHRSKFEQERKDAEPYNPSSAHMGNPHHQQTHPPPLLPLPLPQHQFPSSGSPSVPNAVTVVAPAHLPDSTTESWSTYFTNHKDGKTFNKSSTLKHRCRDYDGKSEFTFATILLWLCLCDKMKLLLFFIYINVKPNILWSFSLKVCLCCLP